MFFPMRPSSIPKRQPEELPPTGSFDYPHSPRSYRFASRLLFAFFLLVRGRKLSASVVFYFVRPTIPAKSPFPFLRCKIFPPQTVFRFKKTFQGSAVGPGLCSNFRPADPEVSPAWVHLLRSRHAPPPTQDPRGADEDALALPRRPFLYPFPCFCLLFRYSSGPCNSSAFKIGRPGLS